MNPMTMQGSNTNNRSRSTGRIAQQLGGGLLILFVGIGIGAYPNERRLEDEVTKKDDTCKVSTIPVDTLPAGTQIVIPLPSEDSYWADYREGALHITIDR